MVLTAYEYRCTVCGFDVRLAGVSVALDAAHIRWVQAAGPDEETYGLAGDARPVPGALRADRPGSFLEGATGRPRPAPGAARTA